MKVWFINHYAVPPTLSGGTRHYDLLLEMKKRGEDVTIFASSFNYQTLSETMEYAGGAVIERMEQGVPFVWIRTFPYRQSDWRRVVNMLSYAVRVAFHCFRREDEPDVVVGSSVHPFAALAGYFIAKKYDVPFVFEVRDLWPQTLIDTGIPKWHPFIIMLAIIERFLYARSDQIVTLLPAAAEYILQFGVPTQKVSWVPNGVSAEAFNRVAAETADEDGTRHFNVTYCGAIGKCNNLDNLIEAARILQDDPEVIFNIVGNGSEKDRLVASADELGLTNVRFHQAVPKNDVPQILRLADALIFNLEDSPVFRFGISSNKLYDYMASGRPVVFCCNASNNPVEDAGAGISVPASDPVRLADAIRNIKNLCPKDRRAMGEKGRNYVQNNHFVPSLADRFARLLRDACSARNRAGTVA